MSGVSFTDLLAEYSLSKSVHLTPDIVEYDAGATAPLYDLIIGKQTLHDIRAVLDFKEKTITDAITILFQRHERIGYPDLQNYFHSIARYPFYFGMSIYKRSSMSL